MKITESQKVAAATMASIDLNETLSQIWLR